MLVQSVPPNCLECTVPDTLSQQSVVLQSMFSETFAVPAWAIRHTDNEDDANMAVQLQSVKISMTTGKVTGKDAGKDAVEIYIPVLVNKKAVKSKQELLLYKEQTAKSKPPKRRMEVSMESVSKAKA